MNDLINRQEAIDEFWKSEVEFKPSQIDEVMRILCKVPTIEIDPIVRCKNCRYHANHWCERTVNLGLRIKMPEDGYCYFGERKDEEKNYVRFNS